MYILLFLSVMRASCKSAQNIFKLIALIVGATTMNTMEENFSGNRRAKRTEVFCTGKCFTLPSKHLQQASSCGAWWCYPLSGCRNNEAERGMIGCVRGATMIIHNFFTLVSLGAVSSSLVRQTGLLLLLLLRQDDVSMEVHLVPQLGVVHDDRAAAPGLRVHAHAQVGYVILNAVTAHRPEKAANNVNQEWVPCGAAVAQLTGDGRGGEREGPAACRVFAGVVADLLNRVYQAPEPDIMDPYLKEGQEHRRIMQWG